MDPSQFRGATLLFDVTTREMLSGADADAITAFFVREITHLRTLVRAGLRSAEAYALASQLVRGAPASSMKTVGRALLHLYLSETALATGMTVATPAATEAHAISCIDEISGARCSESTRLRVLSTAHMHLSIALKATGSMDQAVDALDALLGAKDQPKPPLPWVIDSVRQRVMMRQSAWDHLLLLESASLYKDARPLEYYRSLKRGYEFFLNRGLKETARSIEPHLMSAFLRVQHVATPIMSISLTKNVAQRLALDGQGAASLRLLHAAGSEARANGLQGQVRQIDSLRSAVQAGEVKALLETFRVPG